MKEKLQKLADGISIDNLPDKYEIYREQIKTLRGYGLGLTTYEEVINWLKSHNGQTPRGMIGRKGKRVKTDDLTREERYERNLYFRMSRLPEFVAYKKTKGISIDKLPEEYKQFKEQIIALREFEQMRTSEKALQKIRASVGKKIDSNDEARKELSEVVKEAEKDKDGQIIQ